MTLWIICAYSYTCSQSITGVFHLFLNHHSFPPPASSTPLPLRCPTLAWHHALNVPSCPLLWPSGALASVPGWCVALTFDRWNALPQTPALSAAHLCSALVLPAPWPRKANPTEPLQWYLRLPLVLPSVIQNGNHLAEACSMQRPHLYTRFSCATTVFFRQDSGWDCY